MKKPNPDKNLGNPQAWARINRRIERGKSKKLKGKPGLLRRALRLR